MLRRGEIPPEGHGTERLAFHTKRASAGTSNQSNNSVTRSIESSPKNSSETQGLPQTLRDIKREVLRPGLGEKLYQIA